MKVQDIIDRLIDQAPLLQSRVYHHAAITEIVERSCDTPTAVVYRLPPTVEDGNQGMGSVYHQPIRRRFQITLAARAPREDHDAEAMADAAEEIYAALAGWSPSPDIQLEVDAPEDEPQPGTLAVWYLNFSYLDYLRYQR